MTILNHKIKIVLTLALLLHGAHVGAAKIEPSPSPYGTCAHLAGGMEYDAMPQNLVAMRNAGIRWARADFSWSSVERKKGVWTFDHLDTLLDNAEKHGITILPILDYHVEWARPAYKHPKEWREYVRRLVERYKDRIQYWEVWNEQNLKGFWGDEPKPEDYVPLLKLTYETIKSIDPNLKVVYGGLAGVPFEYLEKTLQNGAGKYFDVMNIHPYRGGMITQKYVDNFVGDIQKVRDLLEKYGVGEKPIWITEMGWATPPTYGHFPCTKKVVQAGLDIVYPEGFEGKAAFLVDPNYEPSWSITPEACAALLPEGVEWEFVKLAELSTLEPAKHPVLILPPGEFFPLHFMSNIQKYVKKGGFLILTGGVPIYYDVEQDENGVWRRPAQSRHIGAHAADLRISWFAWWTRQGTPETAALAPAVGQKGVEGIPSNFQGTRFFDAARLKEGDRLIPILNGVSSDFSAPVACVYEFNSDYRGAILASSIMGEGVMHTNRCLPENQGIFLAQAILLALSNGVERYFVYEFQAVERDDVDPEHHFGITHRDLSPKTGYLAYKTLTTMRPEGSSSFAHKGGAKVENLCVFSWTRPDGKIAYALWSPGSHSNQKVRISGTNVQAFDLYGESIDIEKTLDVTPKIIYIVGEKPQISIQ
ncbi:MAG: beta-galactosidase [Planctomycetia bacterium]|nr:beta-galactosidase [Planctomycetia bacterium]